MACLAKRLRTPVVGENHTFHAEGRKLRLHVRGGKANPEG